MTRKFNSDIYSTEIKSCPVGSEKGYKKTLVLDENGYEHLITEEYDHQAVIDSFEESCSIERIISSHGLGDDLLLNQSKGAYLDEDSVNAVKSSQTLAQNDLNIELFKLYQAKDYDMSFEDFSKAVVSGQFDSLKVKVKEDNV